MQPLVSVVLLTFNSQAYIGRALSSLRRQSYRHIEIVVVDNGSTDDTHRIVENFGHVVWLPLPGSDMGMARNHGVRHSHGDYLMFLDSDDFYLAHKVESQVIAMNARPELGVSFTPAYIYRTGQSDKLGIKSNTKTLLTLIDFLSGYCYTLATICIRRSAWDAGLRFGEGELGRYGEDWRFQLSLAHKGVAFDVIDAPAVVVEIREGSHTSWDIQPKMKALALNAVEGILKTSTGLQIGPATGQAILDSYRFKLTVSLILVGRIGEARAVLQDIRSTSKMLAAGTLLKLAMVLPYSWIRRSLELAWTQRQDNTFHWSAPSRDIGQQISELTLNPLQANAQ